MSEFIINGGKKLNGEIKISGSKNAALPIIAASLLNKEKVTLYNVPNIEDVNTTIKILRVLGCKVTEKCDKIEISSQEIKSTEIPYSIRATTARAINFPITVSMTYSAIS